MKKRIGIILVLVLTLNFATATTVFAGDRDIPDIWAVETVEETETDI